jgi:nucleotide-binding universal stress UspA family protein
MQTKLNFRDGTLDFLGIEAEAAQLCVTLARLQCCTEKEVSVMQIVVLLKGSRLAEAILPHAVALARALHDTVTLVRIITPPKIYMSTNVLIPEGWYHKDLLWTFSYLTSIAQRVEAEGVKARVVALDGEPVEAINVYLEQHEDVRCIAMASHCRQGFERWVMNSVAYEILKSIPKPLMLLHPSPHELSVPRKNLRASYHTITVSLDGSARSEQVLQFARSLTATFDARIVLIMTSLTSKEPLRAGESNAYLEQQAQQLRAKGLKVETEILLGKLSAQLEAFRAQHPNHVLMTALRNEEREQLAIKFLHDTCMPLLLMP